MATIQDIAREAGVSHGTVSNVLNGKGNVSSEKIQRVLEAANRHGFSLNARARMLRSGSSKTLAVVLPNIESRQYENFFSSFEQEAEVLGYETNLFTTRDKQENERNIIRALRSNMIGGAAVFTCLTESGAPYYDAGFEEGKVLFVERKPEGDYPYIGFDYAAAGRKMAARVLERGYTQIALLMENRSHYDQGAFLKAFVDTLGDKNTGCRLTVRETNFFRKNQHILQLFSENSQPQAIFVTNFGLAQTVRNVYKAFFHQTPTDIYTLSPLFTLPEGDFRKYELDYHQLGSLAARRLAQPQNDTPRHTVLPCQGFRHWGAAPAVTKPASLSVLTIDSLSARLLKSLIRLYTDSTGVDIRVTVLPYDGMFETLSSMGKHNAYDVIRLDMTWLSWFAERLLVPLEQIDPEIRTAEEGFFPGLTERISTYKDTLYTLPSTPSVQLLFYRRDLFESQVQKRLYQETYGKKLRPPTSFGEYNQIARFFTQSLRPSSPVEYGSTLTLGNTTAAALEFLARFFSHSQDLYQADGRLMLDSPAARSTMAELAELKDYTSPRHCAWWTDAAQEFAKGGAAMTILQTNFASGMVGPNSIVADNIGWSIIPGGTPLISGGVIGVSKFTDHPKEALRFLRWLSREEVASANTLLGGVSPCLATYENYEIIHTYPWLSLAKECYAIAKNPRIPGSDRPFDEKQFLGILGTAVNSVVNGTMTVDEGLQFAQNTLDFSNG